jgi:hypothetical protein
MLNVVILSIIMPSIVMLNALILSAITLNVFILMVSFAECHYAEYHSAECRYAECRGAIKTAPNSLLFWMNFRFLNWICQNDFNTECHKSLLKLKLSKKTSKFISFLSQSLHSCRRLATCRQI